MKHKTPVEGMVDPAEVSIQNRVLLRADNIFKSFGGNIVLNDVSLQVTSGEIVLLHGENGSGKTTLLNILTGNLQPDFGELRYMADVTPRRFNFPREWWQQLNPWDHFLPEFVAQEGISRTWQDVRLFKSQNVRNNIAIADQGQSGENPLACFIASRNVRRDEARVQKTSESLLSGLGLQAFGNAYADRISFGQTKRVAIARSANSHPSVLILDEPLAGLDDQGMADVLMVLKDLVSTHALTLIIVEHAFNQPKLRSLVTTEWFLSKGKLMVIDARSNPAAGASSSDKWPEWGRMLDLKGRFEEINTQLPRGAFLTRLSPRDIPKGQPCALDLQDLVVARGSRPVIGVDDDGNNTGLSLKLHYGEIGVLQAPNGWGKSTLIGAIAGLNEIASGRVLLNGKNLAGPPSDRVRSGLKTFFGGDTLFESLTRRECMTLAGVAPTALDEAQEDKAVGSMSGGQRQYLGLQCCLQSNLQGPKVLLLDEPFAMLDRDSIRRIVEMVQPDSRTATLICIPLVSRKHPIENHD